MKTLVSFMHNRKLHEVVLSTHQTANAPAMLFIKHPQLTPSNTRIINCTSGKKARLNPCSPNYAETTNRPTR